MMANEETLIISKKESNMPKTPQLRPCEAPAVDFEDGFSLPEAYSLEECDITSRTFSLDSSDCQSFFSESSCGSVKSLFNDEFNQKMMEKYPSSAVEMSFLSLGLLQSFGSKLMGNVRFN